MDSVNEVALDMGFLSLCLMTLWLYLPGFLANTFAMMWGKWLPKQATDLGLSMVGEIGKMVTEFLAMGKHGMDYWAVL